MCEGRRPTDTWKTSQFSIHYWWCVEQSARVLQRIGCNLCTNKQHTILAYKLAVNDSGMSHALKLSKCIKERGNVILCTILDVVWSIMWWIERYILVGTCILQGKELKKQPNDDEPVGVGLVKEWGYWWGHPYVAVEWKIVMPENWNWDVEGIWSVGPEESTNHPYVKMLVVVEHMGRLPRQGAMMSLNARSKVNHYWVNGYRGTAISLDIVWGRQTVAQYIKRKQ